MKPVSFATEAAQEVEEATAWYQGREPGLGDEFLNELQARIAAVQTSPGALARLRDLDPALGVRRALLARFPYAVVFRELAEEIRILAVCHVRRRPGYWLQRVEDA